MADLKCSLCGNLVPEESFYMHRKMEKAIVEFIKGKNPQWVEIDGSCARCYEYFRTLSQRAPEENPSQWRTSSEERVCG